MTDTNNKISIENMNYTEFFSLVYDLKGISQLWIKELDMLKVIQPDISDTALKFLCIYFSLLDDGNTCIKLDAAALMNKWSEKWNGLLLVKDKENEKDYELKSFEPVINQGIEEVLSNKLNSLISKEAKNRENEKPFVINDGWLFAAKFYEAKLRVEERIKALLCKKGEASAAVDSDKLCKKFTDMTSKIHGKDFVLKEKQMEAVTRGQSENIIITGGPGTGKTTVVCYLLWELLSNPSYADYSLYLAAPSGKAADRMKESILGSLSNLKPEYQDEKYLPYKKLSEVIPSTIHRLLSYKPQYNGFLYNEKYQFEDKSIFVIDEASMIDIDLFRSLLQAIPDKARLFILGDKNQLPSVQEGAVLGELLSKKTDSVIELNEAQRFAGDSQVGKLSQSLQKADDSEMKEILKGKFQLWKDCDKEAVFRQKDEKDEKDYPVSYIQLSEMEKRKQIKEIAVTWANKFYKPLITSIAGKISRNQAKEDLDQLWKMSVEARILCAERESIRGVENLNETICKCLNGKIYSGAYFPGQLLMLTKNQSLFNLFNGDSGIVVRFEASEMDYLMLKKAVKAEESLISDKTSDGIIRIADYIFYPLYLLPKETMEVAYVITIHKSQGSGYNNILVFLPEKKGHPLLNRQILYTAITRTSGSASIVANEEIMLHARNTVISRDTQIEL